MRIRNTFRYITVIIFLFTGLRSNAQSDVYASYITDSSADFQQSYKAIDASRTNFAYISTAITAPSSYIRFGFASTAVSGNAINIIVQGGAGQVLTSGILSSITVRLYDALGNNVVNANGPAQLELYQLSSGNNVYAVRYVTDPAANYTFKEARVELSGILSGSLSSFRIYGAYYQQSCPAIIANSVFTSGTNLTLTGYVSNPANAADAATTNFATLTVPSGLLSPLAPAYLDLAFPVNGKGGDYVGVTVAQATSLLNNSLLGNVSIQAYSTLGLPVATQNGFTTTDLKDIGGGEYMLGFVTGAGTYDIARVRITLNGAIGSSQDINVYNGFHYRFNSEPVAITASGSLNTCDSVVLTAVDPSGGTSFLWSNGATGGSITVKSSGTYNVHVADDQSCTRYSIDVPVTVYPAIAKPVIAGDTAQCAGVGGMLHTTIAYTSYAWSNGATTPSVATTGPGLYSVTVTDANGCSAKDSATVVIDTVNVSIIGDTLLCAGVSGMLRTAATYSSYLWSTGTTAATIPVSGPGTFYVTVKDAKGCSGHDTVMVSTAAFTRPVITGDTVLCPGASGTLQTAAAYSSYLWSTGATSSSIFITAAGTYSVRVTNAAGCIGSDTVIVTSPLAKPVITGDTILCTGTSGTLRTSSTYSTYLWSTGATTPTISITLPGLYSVSVSASGCTATDNVLVTVMAPLHPVIVGDTALCPAATGTLRTAATYTGYLWNTGATTPTITITTPGLYYVTVGDPSGCPGSDSVMVTTLPGVPPVIVGDSVLCAGSTGSLHTTATYSSYSWSTGATSSSITISAAGVYSVTVTNSSGCTLSDAITVIQDAVSVIIDSQVNAGCGGAASGRIATHAENGIAPYTYAWSTGQSTPTISGLAAGSYTVTATDALGCSSSAAATLSQSAALSVSLAVINVKCFGDASGSITATIAGGSGNYQYTWSNGGTTAAINDLSAATYTVHVSDNASGCAGDGSATVTQPVAALGVQAGSTGVTCAGNDGSITINASGGSVPYSYTADGAAATNAVNNATAGDHSIIVTDANGCTASAAVHVADDCNSTIDSGRVRVHNIITPNGDGQNDVLIIDGIADHQHVSLQIFDKWGDLVYTESNYHNTWGGTDKKGNDLQSGTYYYLVKLNDTNTQNTKPDQTGFIMIQR